MLSKPPFQPKGTRENGNDVSCISLLIVFPRFKHDVGSQNIHYALQSWLPFMEHALVAVAETIHSHPKYLTMIDHLLPMQQGRAACKGGLSVKKQSRHIQCQYVGRCCKRQIHLFTNCTLQASHAVLLSYDTIEYLLRTWGPVELLGFRTADGGNGKPGRWGFQYGKQVLRGLWRVYRNSI